MSESLETLTKSENQVLKNEKISKSLNTFSNKCNGIYKNQGIAKDIHQKSINQALNKSGRAEAHEAFTSKSNFLLK